MIAMSIDKLRPGMKVGKTIYGSNGQTLLAVGITLNEKFINRLKQLEISSIYITNDNLSDVEIDEVISEQTRVSAVKTAREMMSKIKLGSNLDTKVVSSVVNNIIDELLANSQNIINLIDIRANNDYIFAHSVNVAVMSIILGIALNYDQIKLRNLATGALFHDIGKIMLPEELNAKFGELTTEEIGIYQKHSTLGFEILRKTEDISLFSAHVAFQHHERVDGQGYPRGLAGDEIHEFARIVTVADVYDNMTIGTKEYKKVYPYEAVEFIMANSGSKFDPNLVKLFLKSIAIFPVGSVTLLNTGEIGVVIKVNKSLPTRPVIRVLKDYRGNLLSPGYDIDLVHKTTYFIVKTLDGVEV